MITIGMCVSDIRSLHLIICTIYSLFLFLITMLLLSLRDE